MSGLLVVHHTPSPSCQALLEAVLEGAATDELPGPVEVTTRPALAAGDVWLKAGANLLLFGPPGGGKSHLAAAIGLALVENGWRVLFQRTTDLVQRLQTARRELALEAYIAKLDRYDLLILDDIAYVSKDRDETSVLFELIAARYERRSLLITANQPFGEWGRVFPDQAMTLAAIDRLVHHATILEMNVESFRRKAGHLSPYEHFDDASEESYVTFQSQLARALLTATDSAPDNVILDGTKTRDALVPDALQAITTLTNQEIAS